MTPEAFLVRAMIDDQFWTPDAQRRVTVRSERSRHTRRTRRSMRRFKGGELT
jgi:hypothetical protein